MSRWGSVRAVGAALATITATAALCGCGAAAHGGGADRAGIAKRTGIADRAPISIADRAPISIADRTHQHPSPPSPGGHGRALASPVAALAIYATVYINWNAADVAARLRALARASVGQARSAMILQAAEVASDPELRQAGIANHGRVEAIAPVIGAAANSYVVVTREWTTAADSAAYQGLAPQWHVTLASVRRQGRDGWVVSAWQPES
jgi:hypothetical protein